MGKAGRKTKLTPDLMKEIVKYIAGGASYKDSCIFVGIGKRTLFNWKTRGEEDEKKKVRTIYRDLCDEVERAEVAAKMRRIGIITKAEKEDARLALEMLARKYPEEYGRKDHLKVDANVKAEVHVTMDDLLDETAE